MEDLLQKPDFLNSLHNKTLHIKEFEANQSKLDAAIIVMVN